MVADALECTRCDFRNGHALRLDARLGGRGAICIHLCSRRRVRPVRTGSIFNTIIMHSLNNVMLLCVGLRIFNSPQC